MSAADMKAALAAEVEAGTVDLTEEWPRRWQEVLDAQEAERQSARAAITPHVTRPPKRKPPRMSGPRYFNLMRAIEDHPDEYAEYLPTTYCGAERTTEDWDRRTALSKTHTAAAAERGVCTACLDVARAEQ